MAAGLTALIVGCSGWRCENTERYLTFLALAMVAATLKIRLPRMTGTYSASFVFVLIGVAELSLAETMTIGCAGAIVQSLWRTRRSPERIQVAFSVAAITLSVAASYTLSHLAVKWLAVPQTDEAIVPLVLGTAVSLYFVTNTGLVAIVLALTEGGTLRTVWRQWCLWSFPYHLAGAVIASIISLSTRTGGWKSALLLLPLLYLVYYYWRLFVARQSGESDVLAGTG